MKTNWLKGLRKKADLSQEELAAKLQIEGFNYTAGSISHWEVGRYDAPLQDEQFRKSLAKALKVDVRTLLMDAGYEIIETDHSEAANRAAAIMDRLSPDKQRLALGILEQLLETA